jgi:hypothetical protein
MHSPTGLDRPGLLDIIFPPDRGGLRHLAMLGCYADRSTVASEGGTVFVVAGVIATAESWKIHFAREWRRILLREGIDVFHMTDYETRALEPYKSWSNDKRISFFRELIDVVRVSETIAGAVAVDLDALAALTEEERQQLGHPYRFCGALLMRMFATWLRRHAILDSIAYVFESGDLGSHELKAAVNSLPKHTRQSLLFQSFVYGDKDEYIQLQAADMLAYEAGKAALRDIGADDRAHRKSLLAILDGVPSRGYLFDRRTLRNWIDLRRDPFGYAE